MSEPKANPGANAPPRRSAATTRREDYGWGWAGGFNQSPPDVLRVKGSALSRVGPRRDFFSEPRGPLERRTRLRQKLELFRGRDPAEDLVPVGVAAEALDDFTVALCEVEVVVGVRFQ